MMLYQSVRITVCGWWNKISAPGMIFADIPSHISIFFNIPYDTFNIRDLLVYQKLGCLCLGLLPLIYLLLLQSAYHIDIDIF